MTNDLISDVPKSVPVFVRCVTVYVLAFVAMCDVIVHYKLCVPQKTFDSPMQSKQNTIIGIFRLHYTCR